MPSFLLSFPRVVREVIKMGYGNVRFYSYIRWNGDIRVGIFFEMQKKQRGGAPLIYGSRFSKLYRGGAFPHIRDELDDVADGGGDASDLAKAFRQNFLIDTPQENGCYDRQYLFWLDEIIKITPDGAIPITDEPCSGSYGPRYIDFHYFNYSESDAPPTIISLPPGHVDACNPFSENRKYSQLSELQRSSDVQKSKFKIWLKTAEDLCR